MKRASCSRNKTGRAAICYRAKNSLTIEKLIHNAQYRKMLFFLALRRGGEGGFSRKIFLASPPPSNEGFLKYLIYYLRLSVAWN